VRLLWLIPVEPAHLPQYLRLFVIGVVAGRGRWFVELPFAVGARWFAIGVAAFVVARVFPYQSLPASITQDLAWGFLEAFVCVGIILGLSVTFRQYFNASSRWLTRLDDNVYGVYVTYVFILVGLQSAIIGFDLSALAKFVSVTAAGLIVSFAFTAAIRRIPGVARVV
jgi:glucans biosynthesis protein C